ncbi:translation initiation protein sua5 [Zymoseptoria brevis]|uniref:Threonylcarbamoyl-AMP synthase n=1 Tax=Zymoseptoria brevis TaxID=1047168 RepID=A0A0F4GVS8_9PEZI|nr:translation initiation protein sua5 [Zymoseptoria brevis]
METTILAVDARKIGVIKATPNPDDILDGLDLELDTTTVDAQHLQEAAEQLKNSDIPVAFPTETVYGLGADATRSAAVRGIYKAKQRPSDNPLIVHFASLKQLRSLLRGSKSSHQTNGLHDTTEDPIPAIYKPLISRFWPGPLTIILPNPENSPLAPEVTAGLSTFGARMPRHVLALALIQTAGVPVAAPSANASTKPSPTAAEHVAYDLDGRIETVIDGGPCDVGVESTVVDGLSSPPVVLRPGGLSLEQIRTCPGWGDTQIAYKNTAEANSQPRAPGMKYRHYSPKAVVILYEVGRSPPSSEELVGRAGVHGRLGIVRTESWVFDKTAPTLSAQRTSSNGVHDKSRAHTVPGFAGMLLDEQATDRAKSSIERYQLSHDGATVELLDISLGRNTGDIARGLFSALRDLDRQDVDAIFVEGIDDNEGDTAAAIMNRLRKAAEIRVEG